MLEKSENFGIKREQICLDMGIGFGKDYEDNLTPQSNYGRLKEIYDDICAGYGAEKRQ